MGYQYADRFVKTKCVKNGVCDRCQAEIPRLEDWDDDPEMSNLDGGSELEMTGWYGGAIDPMPEWHGGHNPYRALLCTDCTNKVVEFVWGQDPEAQ